MAEEDRWEPIYADDKAPTQMEPSERWEPVYDTDKPVQETKGADRWEPIYEGDDVSQKRDQSSQESDQPEKQGVLEAGARGAAHSVIPGAVGAIAATAAAPFTGPIGAIAAGAGGAWLAGKAQSAVEHWLAPEQEEKLAQAEEQHPFATGVGEVAGMLPSMGVRGASTLVRAAMAGVGGGVDLALGGSLEHAAGVAAGSAALGGPRGWVESAGKQAGEKFSTLMGRKAAEAQGAPASPIEKAAQESADNTAGDPNVDSVGDAEDVKTGATIGTRAKGVASEQPPPEGTAGDPVTAENNGPKRGGSPDHVAGPETEYAKDTPPAEGTIRPTGISEVPEDMQQAITGKKPGEEPAPAQQQQQEQGGGGEPPEQPAQPAQPRSTLVRPEAAGNEAIEAATKAAMPEGAPRSTLMKQAAQGMEEAPRKTGRELLVERGFDPEEVKKMEVGEVMKKVKESEPGYEPPEPGPAEARLNKPPIYESAPNDIWAHARRIFAPEFMSQASNKAGEAIRRGQGNFQALDDLWTARLEKHYPAVEAEVKAGNGEALMDKLEGGKSFPEYKLPENLKPLADDIKAMNNDYKDAIAKNAKDPDAVQAWNEQHLPHLYSEPEKVQNILNRGGGGGVRGSGGSLNERHFETYAQAKAEKGLTPKYTNPLDSLKAYRAELGKFLGNRDAIQEMRDAGALKYAMPEKKVGASGQFGDTAGNKIHPDWEPVQGLSMQGRQAYMPRDAAHVFSNYMSPGLKGNPNIRPFYNLLRETGNRLTQVELGLFNGFHAFVTGNESFLSNMARGVSQIRGGDTSGGISTLLKSPAAPVMNYMEGRRAMSAVTGEENMFSRRKPLTEEDRAIVRAAQDAGVMPMGRGFAPDVNMSKGETYYKSYMRGSFGREMSEAAQRMKDSPLKNVPKEVWDQIGRTMQTMSEPLFGHYIPALKFGTLIEDARAFVKTGGVDIRTPQGQQALNVFMRKQSNAIDNRLGEMNSNNMFMNGAMRDAGYVTMRSMSWFLGTAKALGGGYGGAIKDLMSGDIKKLGNKLDMTHRDYDPNFAYAVAFPFGIGLMGAAYQYFKTGEMPGELRDLYAPKTGGKIPGFGGKGTVDERVMLPGYHRDIFGWMNDPKQEAYNKQNTLLSTAEEELGGRDSFGRPFVRPNATFMENATDRAKYALGKVTPFAARSQMDTPKEGTGLGPVSRAFGFRSAGTQYTDPEMLGNYLKAKYQKEWDAKQRSDMRQSLGGRNPPPEPKQRKPRSTL